MPKYPSVQFTFPHLSEPRSTAMAIVGEVKRRLIQAGATRQELDEFVNEALSGNYLHVKDTIRQWVTCTN